LQSANPALARMLGFASAAELLADGQNIGKRMIVSAEVRQRLNETLRSQGAMESIEAELLRRDGSRIWVRLNVHTVLDAHGLLSYYEGTCQDITEAKRSLEILERARRLQKAILDNIPDPAWLKDNRGRFLACNEALGRTVGRHPEEILGNSASDLGFPDAATIQREDEQVMHTRQSTTFEGQRSDASGNVRWFETSKSPLLGDRGEVTGVVGIARDVTERKRAEEELWRLPRRIIDAQEAERQRVSRELHDGVNQLIASAQMRLQKVSDSVPEFRPAAREILARCNDLMVQALEENRRIAYNLRPGDLDELGLVTASHHLCTQFHTRTNVLVKCRIGRLGQLAPAIELNLFRIIQEAFNNVEKHARAKTVRLEMTRDGDTLRLRIQDDGSGFETRRLKQRRGNRRGMGITNILQRASALDAVCDIQSAPTKGTTVTVSVPCTSTKAASGEVGSDAPA
jgi:two-component system, NarL family, sensor histidine kinase UhpB